MALVVSKFSDFGIEGSKLAVELGGESSGCIGSCISLTRGPDHAGRAWEEKVQV